MASDTLPFDEDMSRRIEAAYVTADVAEQRRRVRELLRLEPGEHVLDIGCGPGLLAAEMAADVGSGGSVIGVDPSEQMLALARRRSATDGTDVARMTFEPGDAVALPCADAAVDAITSTQVYEYVADMPAALAEVRRVLRPGGRVLVLDTDWDSVVWHSSDDSRMRTVLAAWDEHLVDPYLPRRLGRLLTESGFTVTDVQTVPMLNVGYRTDTYSAGLIGFIGAFVPGRRGVDADTVAAWAADLAALGPDYFFSINRYVFLARLTAQ
jgi:ubiquinone/menaquinone biosynthesis C-methylase UbiE